MMLMSTFISVLLACWIIITITANGVTIEPWIKKDLLQGYEFGTDITLTTQARDPRCCVMMCMWQKETCMSVTYDVSTETCIGYNVRFTAKSGGRNNSNTVYFSSVECPDPPDVSNALATAGSNTFGSVRSYECYPGYNISGDFHTTCLSNGNWSPGNFTCTSCGSHPTVHRTIVSQVGNMFYYECDNGYIQNGSINYTTCQPDGQYTDMDISCNDCSTYDSSFAVNPNKLFDPPWFRNSYSGSSITVNYCINKCINKLGCVAMYYHSSTQYCALQTRRVYDDPSYSKYYTTNEHFDEYIRRCTN